MSQSLHDLQEGDLIAYIEGATDPHINQRITNDPALLAEAIAMQQMEGVCSAALFRAACPSGEALLLAVNGLLDNDALQRITDHLSVCEPCRIEFMMFENISAPPTTVSPSPIRALLDYAQQAGQELIAILRPLPAPMFALRGVSQQDLVYHAGEYQIVLTVAPPVVAEPMRHIEGQITLHHDPTCVPHGASVQLLWEGRVAHSDQVDEFGYFALDNVESGSYELRIALDPNVIVIRDLAIA